MRVNQLYSSFSKMTSKVPQEYYIITYFPWDPKKQSFS